MQMFGCQPLKVYIKYIFKGCTKEMFYVPFTHPGKLES